MFRALLVAALVVAAFGVTLFKSGDLLKSWETPEASSAQAMPAKAKKKSKARRSTPRKRARSRPRRREPAWLRQLNALCRRGQDEAAAIPTPITEAGLVDYLRQFERLNARWNRRAEAILRTVGNDKAARLISLFGEEERLLSASMSAVNEHRFKEFQRLRPRFLAVARSENRLLKGLGAHDCTLVSLET